MTLDRSWALVCGLAMVLGTTTVLAQDRSACCQAPAKSCKCCCEKSEGCDGKASCQTPCCQTLLRQAVSGVHALLLGIQVQVVLLRQGAAPPAARPARQRARSARLVARPARPPAAVMHARRAARLPSANAAPIASARPALQTLATRPAAPPRTNLVALRGSAAARRRAVVPVAVVPITVQLRRKSTRNHRRALLSS